MFVAPAARGRGRGPDCLCACRIANQTSLPEVRGVLARRLDADSPRDAVAVIRDVIPDKKKLARWETRRMPPTARGDALRGPRGYTVIRNGTAERKQTERALTAVAVGR